MKRALLGNLLVLLLAALFAAPAADASLGFEDVGLEFTKADESPELQAGSHPFAVTTTLDVNTKLDPDSGQQVPDGIFRDLIVSLPAGLVGTPDPVPTCSNVDFLEVVEESQPACPNESAIGIAAVGASLSPGPGLIYAPVYNLKPPPGAAAKFGLIVFSAPVTVEVGVNPEPPYNVVAHVTNISQIALFYGTRLTLWGTPASPAHDALRGHCVDSLNGTPTEAPSRGLCPLVGIPEKPFLTLPRSCTGPLTTLFQGNAWLTDDQVEDVATTPGMSGCEALGFEAEIDSLPTTQRAESAAGLDFNLDIEDEGLTDPSKNAQSDIQKAVVTLPAGVTVNPSVADGLATCAPAEYGRETLGSEPGDGCPQASKVGTVEVETPLLENRVLEGSVFVAQQDDPATPVPGAENPFDTMIAMYLVIRNPDLGILVKQAGKVEPDAVTGQLRTSFGEVPQFPFSHLRFHFRPGVRAPLVTPADCGGYTTVAEFTPWANPGKPFTTSSDFQVGAGVGGGPCPGPGPRPFRPGFTAGTLDNGAGSYSPFYMRLSRQDGEQELTRFSSILPPGLVGKLAGVGRCPDAAIAVAKAKTGRQELADPSCPAGSEIGRTLGGAGVGTALTYVPGKIYLGGPVGTHPLSAIAITPAVAGPFDAGTVVVREAVDLDPTTAEVQVDGSASDPIPRILKGIPLHLRDLQVWVDRQNFTLNPTSCDPSQVRATLFGSFLDALSPGDDVAVAATSRFQAANCSSLGFKPRLSLKLTGKTRRTGHPALKAILRARPGDANIGEAAVTLPHSAFLEQAHIRTICTRVQFAAAQCPAGSIYGHAKAITPLLDEPLEGNVYLRSSSHELPDLVVALRGIVDIDVVGRVDSRNGGIRTTFENVPDAPVSTFVLEMRGGKKGLIVNSRNLCLRKSAASARFVGQNGRLREFRPVVKNDCAKGGKHGRRGR
jgi:hypothetical protein